MKIALTDACIFIDIHDLKLTPVFFSMPMEIHSTVDVYNELYDDHKHFLEAFTAVGKLTLHILTDADRKQVQNGDFPQGLSEADKSVIYIAGNIGAMLLSSDRAVRRYAKSKGVDCHGMLWILERLVDSGTLPPTQAIMKLKELMATNIIYQNNSELLEAAAKLSTNWNKMTE